MGCYGVLIKKLLFSSLFLIKQTKHTCFLVTLKVLVDRFFLKKPLNGDRLIILPLRPVFMLC